MLSGCLKLTALLVAIVNIGGCGSGNCDEFNYCSSKAIWHQDITCTTSTTIENQRCKQLQLAYHRDSIDIKQDLNHPLGSKNNWTLLMMASHQGYHGLVEKLLDNGAKEGIDMQDKCGWSALMFAAFTGSSIEVVKLLLEYGANVNQVNNHDRTALFVASGKGHVEIVKLLLQNGANTRHEDIWGKTAIAIGVYFCGLCQPGMVRAFLYNCDNDKEHLRDALFVAYDYCCPEIVDDLIRFGAPSHDIDHIISEPKCKNRESDCERAKLTLYQTKPSVKSYCPTYATRSPKKVSQALLTAIVVPCLFLSMLLFIKRRRCQRTSPPSPGPPQRLVSQDRHETTPPLPPPLVLSMPVLINFPGRRMTLNIPTEISTKYEDFGILLLQDCNGNLIAMLEIQHQRDICRINKEILEIWLSGKRQSSRPVTWDALVQTIRDVQLNTLANDIEDGLQHHSTFTPKL